MELLTVLQLECHMPAKTFCKALASMKTFSVELFAEGRNIYRALVGDCLVEYSFHRMSLLTRNTVTRETLGRDCPVCLETPPILSMDGNFGLVHKTSSGVGHGQLANRHKNLFFEDQENVKEFLSHYGIDKKSNTSECSNFQAGNVIRSKIMIKKLDITGVFGSVCKHDIPVMMLDMTHGERLGYPAYILKKVLQNRTSNLVVMYDIACTLHRHLKVKYKETL
ncbi:hypothetical protein DPMN_171139 [Dreissena polymorpha]|uniref:Uncharacterized protein n=1 Tax=Dreissena polymorpha TaxID=45954 RepID=A0A9D4DZ67_DREPO|nr:hypothetical protein DPMN_171139 [Dreissena polymorpha]